MHRLTKPMLARCLSASLLGFDAIPVTVEVGLDTPMVRCLASIGRGTVSSGGSLCLVRLLAPALLPSFDEIGGAGEELERREDRIGEPHGSRQREVQLSQSPSQSLGHFRVHKGRNEAIIGEVSHHTHQPLRHVDRGPQYVFAMALRR